jgi:hypothetical protein
MSDFTSDTFQAGPVIVRRWFCCHQRLSIRQENCVAPAKITSTSSRMSGSTGIGGDVTCSFRLAGSGDWVAFVISSNRRRSRMVRHSPVWAIEPNQPQMCGDNGLGEHPSLPALSGHKQYDARGPRE